MRVAGIDCGTNSIRLLVADVVGERLRDVSRRMEIVRLGEGVDQTGRLSEAALDRTRAALTDYAKQIEELNAPKVRMVATSASRDAENSAEFTGMVTSILGVEPEVISGDEEAELSFSGAVRGLPSTVDRPYLVVDIGGGSTEFVRGVEDVEAARSVNIGCVRMTERHLHADPPGGDEIAAAEADVRAAVASALAVVDPGRSANALIGLAGSVTTVAALALGLDEYEPDRIHHSRISYESVVKVTADLLGRTKAERLEYGVMHPGRADVIGAGALVLRVIMELSGMREVIASEHDILDGIAWSVLD